MNIMVQSWQFKSVFNWEEKPVLKIYSLMILMLF